MSYYTRLVWRESGLENSCEIDHSGRAPTGCEAQGGYAREKPIDQKPCDLAEQEQSAAPSIACGLALWSR